MLDRLGIKPPLRYLVFPGRVETVLSPGWLGQTGPEHSGLYKVRIQASGIRPPGGQPAHLSIGKETGEETVAGLIEFDLTAPEDSPEVPVPRWQRSESQRGASLFPAGRRRGRKPVPLRVTLRQPLVSAPALMLSAFEVHLPSIQAC